MSSGGAGAATTCAARAVLLAGCPAPPEERLVRAAGFSAAAWSTGGFECLLRATSAVAHRASRSKGRSWRRTRRGSGECRSTIVPLDDIRTGVAPLLQEECGGNLPTGHTVSGVSRQTSPARCAVSVPAPVHAGAAP